MSSTQIQTNQHDESGCVTYAHSRAKSKSRRPEESTNDYRASPRGNLNNHSTFVWGTHAIDTGNPRFEILTRRYDLSNSRSSRPRIHDVKMSRRLSHLAGRHTSVYLNGYYVSLERGCRDGIYIHGVGMFGAGGAC
jgi:hypothetical protein